MTDALAQPPLEGLLVVELGERIGAAVCGSLLAQLGAEVVVFETSSPPVTWGKSAHREQLMPGKLSFAPDLSDPADRQLASDVIQAADVVITSADVDNIKGLDLKDRPHGQIFCELTAFGTSGPLAGQPFSDQELQALSGMAHTTGLEDGPPLLTALPLVEYIGGIHAASAVIAAARVQRLTGAGQSVEIALYDCAFASTSSFLTRLLGDASAEVKRLGNKHPISAPWNVYRGADGWILICTGSDDQWRRLCEIMGRPELAVDPRFKTSIDRVARVEEVDREVQAWVGAQNVADCVSALTSAAIASGPIAPIEDFPREANLHHRSMIRRLSREDGSTYFVPGSPLRMSATPGCAPARMPKVGEDRAEVAEFFGRPRASTPAVTCTSTPTPPLSGIRVIEIGHYTTAPAAARILAALGAEVVKVEPPEGEASRRWPPIDKGQSVFYTISNSGKRSVTLDLKAQEDCDLLQELLKGADVLVENLKPGALSKRGFGPAQLESINPRLVYCAISGFGAQSLYPGRPAFDTVIQAMAGLMDLIRVGDTPVKTGISLADVMGAAIATLSILAALEWRDKGGRGQAIDLSMQDIVAWSTQLAWNGGFAQLPCGEAVQENGGCQLKPATSGISNLEAKSAAPVPILTPRQVLCAEQTQARNLHFTIRDDRGDWPALAPPMRLAQTPPTVQRPAPALGADNQAVLSPLRTMAERKRSSDYLKTRVL